MMTRSIVSLFILALVLVTGLPILAAESADATPAESQIQTALRETNTLSDTQLNKIKSKVRTELRRMVKSGVPQETISKVANQACQMVQNMVHNAGELSKLTNAVSLLSRECINGKDPQEIGEMINQELKNGKTIDAALKQTREQIKIQDRKRTQEQNPQSLSPGSGMGSGSGSGNGGSGSSSGSGSGSGSSGSGSGGAGNGGGRK